MARRRITEHEFDLMVESFRHSPGNISGASRAANVSRPTAHRAWHQGWPYLSDGLSVQQVFAQEQRAARAQILAEQAAQRALSERERQAAQEQAIQARKQEGQMVTLARTASLQGLTISNQLYQVARSMTAKAKEMLDIELQQQPAAHSPEGLLRLTERIVRIGKTLNEQALESMRLERLHLGDPTHILGIVTDQGPQTLDEAEVRVAAAVQAIQNARLLRGMTVTTQEDELPSQEFE